MEIKFFKVKIDLLLHDIWCEEKSEISEDLRYYYYSLRGSIPDIVLERRDSSIHIKKRGALVGIAKSLGYEFIDSVIFDYDGGNFENLLHQGELLPYSMKESRRKENLESKGERIDLYFFKEECISDEIKEELLENVRFLFDRKEWVQLNLKLLNIEFLTSPNCLRVDSIYPSVVEARRTAVLYAELVRKINSISELRSLNGGRVEHLLEKRL